MEVKPNECSVCTDVIKDGEEYHECTNPKNVENPHKVCEDCYQGLKKGYDYDEEILDPQALLPSPRLNADGTPMRDARGNPVMMSRDELIEFYKTQKHASHGEGCPMKDGNLVKKTMGQPKQSVTLRVMDKPAAARGGIHYDSEDELLNKAIKMSLEPSRPGAAAAAAAVDSDEDDAFRAVLLASKQETVNPIQQIHRQLNQRRIRVSEEYVRRIFQQMSRLYPKHDYRAIEETEKYLVENPPPPPPAAPFYPPPPPYDELLRNYPQLRAQRRLPGQPFQPPPLPPLPPGWELLRNPDGQQFYAGPNGETTINFPWNEYDAAQRRGGKKSKMTKSRKGKKSKIIKSRKGKKSKMTKSRRGKKSKMTRKKV